MVYQVLFLAEHSIDGVSGPFDVMLVCQSQSKLQAPFPNLDCKHFKFGHALE